MNDYKTVNARVDSLSIGGALIVRVEEGSHGLGGKKGFVRYVIPDELIKVAIKEDKENYFHGELVHIEKPSEDRIMPRCQHFKVCGGCDLQHIPYQKQLSLKKEMLTNELSSAGLKEMVSIVEDIVPSTPFGFRKRVALHVSSGTIGFYRRESREVFSVKECPIAETSVEAAVKKLAALEKVPFSGLLVVEDVEGEIALTLKLDDSKNIKNLSEIKKCLLTIGMEVKIESAGQTLSSKGNGLEDINTGNFSQVNREINASLQEAVKEWVQHFEPKTVLELYAGAGNFTLPLSSLNCKIVAVEADAELAATGDRTISKLGKTEQVSFYNESVEQFLKREHARVFDVILADPPRAGLRNFQRHIWNTDNFILISCHIPSFVRDAKVLIQQGFKPVAIKAFDMFPQTSYLEVLSVYKHV